MAQLIVRKAPIGKAKLFWKFWEIGLLYFGLRLLGISI